MPTGSQIIEGLTGGLAGLLCWSLPVAVGASAVGGMCAVAADESSSLTPAGWFWYGFLRVGLLFIISLGAWGVVSGVRYGLEAEAAGRWAGVYVPRKYWAAVVKAYAQDREHRVQRRRARTKQAEPCAAPDRRGT